MTISLDREVLISSDSHVMEPHDLWSSALKQRFGDKAPAFEPIPEGQSFQTHPGGKDPYKRIEEMAKDGVSAEVLYPTLGLQLFAIPEADLQEASFAVYNDWLIDYCKIAGERLLGVATISCYDIDHAVAELRRCRNAGLRGAEIWQAPHGDLPLYSEHYEPLWSALEELEMPLSLHILTGFSYHSEPRGTRRPEEGQRGTVNQKMMDAANSLYDFIFYKILDRHPNLKLVIVENEIGWLPFLVQQWDYYFHRFRRSGREPRETDLLQEPSFYINRQVFATFFNDQVGAHMLSKWGQDFCMWSNDYPHGNSTWPNSRRVIERDLGHLPADVLAKVLRENVTRLYNLKVPALA